MNKLVLIFIVIIFCLNCTSQKEVMNSWMGATKHGLIMSWGPPTRISEDGAGGEILLYAKHIYMPPSTNTFYDSYGGSSTSTTQAINYWDYKIFWVNSEGKIYHWMTQQKQIPPIQIDLNIYRRN